MNLGQIKKPLTGRGRGLACGVRRQKRKHFVLQFESVNLRHFVTPIGDSLPTNTELATNRRLAWEMLWN